MVTEVQPTSLGAIVWDERSFDGRSLDALSWLIGVAQVVREYLVKARSFLAVTVSLMSNLK